MEFPLWYYVNEYSPDYNCQNIDDPSSCELWRIVGFFYNEETKEYNDVPESFKGTPIVLLTAALMSIAFFGFSGLI